MTSIGYKITSMLLLTLALSRLSAQSSHGALRQGEERYDKGDFEKAQAAYRKANNSTGDYNAGNAAMQQNNQAAAIGFYRDAVEKSNAKDLKADALYNLGNAYLQQKNYREAITAYENSLRLSPNQADAKKNLQIARRQLQPPPPPPPSTPPPPPPPSPRPRQTYLDQPLQSRRQESPPANIPPETARQMLQKAVMTEEEKNARAYRELAPSNRPSRLKKDW